MGNALGKVTPPIISPRPARAFQRLPPRTARYSAGVALGYNESTDRFGIRARSEPFPRQQTTIPPTKRESLIPHPDFLTAEDFLSMLQRKFHMSKKSFQESFLTGLSRPRRIAAAVFP